GVEPAFSIQLAEAVPLGLSPAPVDYSRGARAPAGVSPEPLPPARRAAQSPSALPDHPSRRSGPAPAATSTGCRETPAAPPRYRPRGSAGCRWRGGFPGYPDWRRPTAAAGG